MVGVHYAFTTGFQARQALEAAARCKLAKRCDRPRPWRAQPTRLAAAWRLFGVRIMLSPRVPKAGPAPVDGGVLADRAAADDSPFKSIKYN